jgi:solute carrier family 13 (sodium-dependent dicarboxylate transporter), member 2/3/5
MSEPKSAIPTATPGRRAEVTIKQIMARIDWAKFGFAAAGLVLLLIFRFLPPFSPAADPLHPDAPAALSRGGQLALGLFLLAAIWWTFEVVPLGVTSLAIVVIQIVFAIARPGQPPSAALTDCFDPAVGFIFGALVFGLVFTKTGLTRRIAYKMVSVMGERTGLLYLGSFATCLLLTLVLAHTTVAATLFPLLMAIYSLYEESERPTYFGKGLFIGMAYACGAGSVITLFGAGRTLIALGFFSALTDRPVSCFELVKYMLPLGAVMVLGIWGLALLWFPPERPTIPGLRERSRLLYQKLGPLSLAEKIGLAVIATTIGLMILPGIIPALPALDRTGIILAATVLFFLLRILEVEDLEKLPWNIVLLFGGSMSLGYCLNQTGAARWLALKALPLFADRPGWVMVLVLAGLCLAMTNFIMNTAAIALLLPAALWLAPYLNVPPELVLFPILATAGMPFMLLIGAAPNAIAYESKQFSGTEFFRVGIVASVLLMAVLALFVRFIWPWLGMPTRLGP